MNVPQLLLDLGQSLKNGEIVRVEWDTGTGKRTSRTGELLKSGGFYVVLTHPSSGRRYRIQAEKVVSMRKVGP